MTASSVTPLATASARDLAVTAVVYIFQLPAMNLRMTRVGGVTAMGM